MKYRNRPVVVEAVQFVKPGDIKKFCPCAESIKDVNKIVGFTIPASRCVVPGGWVIKYPNGQYGSMSNVVFNEKYELIAWGLTNAADVVEKIRMAMNPIIRSWNESVYAYELRQAKAIYHALSGDLVPRVEKCEEPETCECCEKRYTPPKCSRCGHVNNPKPLEEKEHNDHENIT